MRAYRQERTVTLSSYISFLDRNRPIFNGTKPELRVSDKSIYSFRADNMDEFPVSFNEIHCHMIQCVQGKVINWLSTIQSNELKSSRYGI